MVVYCLVFDSRFFVFLLFVCSLCVARFWWAVVRCSLYDVSYVLVVVRCMCWFVGILIVVC